MAHTLAGETGAVQHAVAGAAGSRGAYEAYQILRLGFTVAPVLAGLDKFLHLLVDWDQYLAPFAAGMLPFDGHTFMLIVGVVEIAAGVGVALRPRIFAYVVSAWLLGIVLNLLLHPGSYDATGWGLDLALRDFGLALGALALGRLSRAF